MEKNAVVHQDNNIKVICRFRPLNEIEEELTSKKLETYVLSMMNTIKLQSKLMVEI